jgi:hypothetical protein
MHNRLPRYFHYFANKHTTEELKAASAERLLGSGSTGGGDSLACYSREHSAAANASVVLSVRSTKTATVASTAAATPESPAVSVLPSVESSAIDAGHSTVPPVQSVAATVTTTAESTSVPAAESSTLADASCDVRHAVLVRDNSQHWCCDDVRHRSLESLIEIITAKLR